MADEKKVKSETAESAAVAEFVENSMADWNDDVKIRARFKALSGQRSDWEPLYLFWRDLILKTCRHLNIFIIQPPTVSSVWFRRFGGLTPLSLPRVLLEMHRSGDLAQFPNSDSPTRVSSLFRKVLGFLISSSDDDDNSLPGECYVVVPVLEEKARQVLDVLSESHWMDYCVITMRKFEKICGGAKEGVAVLNYLSARGRAKHLVVSGSDSMEGVKVCLAPGVAISAATDTDLSVLHLTWTVEKLEQQLDLIDQRYQKAKASALACVKSGKRIVALKFAKEMKLINVSRERCAALLERVENVLGVIADAESSKKVKEAIQSSSQAVKDNMINVEEVELCLQEVDENIDSLKRIDDALASAPSYAEMDEDDMEAEFSKLELEIESEMDKVSRKSEIDSPAGVEAADALSEALSSLKLKDGAITSGARSGARPVSVKSMSEEGSLEAA